MPILINEIITDIDSSTDVGGEDQGMEDVMPLEQDELEIVSMLEQMRERRQRLMVD